MSLWLKVPVIASNRIGTEKFSGSEIRFYGGSFITDNKGGIVEQVRPFKTSNISLVGPWCLRLCAHIFFVRNSESSQWRAGLWLRCVWQQNLCQSKLLLCACKRMLWETQWISSFTAPESLKMWHRLGPLEVKGPRMSVRQLRRDLD